MDMNELYAAAAQNTTAYLKPTAAVRLNYDSTTEFQIADVRHSYVQLVNTQGFQSFFNNFSHEAVTTRDLDRTEAMEMNKTFNRSRAAKNAWDTRKAEQLTNKPLLLVAV